MKFIDIRRLPTGTWLKNCYCAVAKTAIIAGNETCSDVCGRDADQRGGTAMKNKWLKIVIGAIVLVNVISLSTLAWLRLRDAQAFSQPSQVHTYGGTNYIVQLLETAVDRVDASCMVIVSLRLKNPNPYEVILKREWFVLLAHEKDYYEPTTLGTIRIPAQGVIEREVLGFMVTDEALAGLIALKIGQQHFVTVKSQRPYTQPVGKGQFVSFRQRDW
jgi:predicted nucleic acid-binding Zn ribbon protein